MHWFPEDKTGDALRRMVERGANLENVYDFEFETLFPSEDYADQFIQAVHSLGFKETNILHIDAKSGWMVSVIAKVHPEHSAIIRLERLFRSVSPEFMGDYDGWSCFVG
jgi:hypothetical protein